MYLINLEMTKIRLIPIIKLSIKMFVKFKHNVFINLPDKIEPQKMQMRILHLVDFVQRLYLLDIFLL